MKQRFTKTKYLRDAIDEKTHKKWEQEFPEYKGKYSFWEFRRFCNGILGEYMEEMSVNPQGVRLPFYMGDMRISYVPVINKPLDYIASKSINKDVPYMNLTTNGRVGKIIWSCEFARKFNKYLPIVGFAPSTGLTKLSKKRFKENPELFKDNIRSANNRKVIHKL